MSTREVWTLASGLGAIALMGSFIFLAANTYQKPNLGDGLVCTNAQGQLTRGEDWKVCHAPRSLLQTMFSGN